VVGQILHSARLWTGRCVSAKTDSTTWHTHLFGGCNPRPPCRHEAGPTPSLPWPPRTATWPARVCGDIGGLYVRDARWCRCWNRASAEAWSTSAVCATCQDVCGVSAHTPPPPMATARIHCISAQSPLRAAAAAAGRASTAPPFKAAIPLSCCGRWPSTNLHAGSSPAFYVQRRGRGRLVCRSPALQRAQTFKFLVSSNERRMLKARCVSLRGAFGVIFTNEPSVCAVGHF
jgi:hypothetical protein